MIDITRTKPILAMFDPIIFPITMPLLLLKIAKILTNSSGRLVPNAITKTPTSNFEMLYFFDIKTD